jgi:hypothetical protein
VATRDKREVTRNDLSGHAREQPVKGCLGRNAELGLRPGPGVLIQ